MHITTRSARITGPVPYQVVGGLVHTIPLGPCLLEHQGSPTTIDIVWGSQGQRSAVLPLAEILAAQRSGHLVVLD